MARGSSGGWIKTSLTISVLMGTVFGGCAAPPPQVRSLPAFTPIETTGDGVAQTERITFNIESEGRGADVTQSFNAEIRSGAPIVISVPLEPVRNRNARGEGLTGVAYTTEFEQQVERALIRRGFDLRDRSKFEAILLEQAGGDTSIGTQAELINAARAGEAEYVLQINEARAVEGTTLKVEPRNHEDVRRFAEDNPGLIESGALDPFDVIVMGAVFNAKVIAVETGSVVWLGTHRVNSLDLSRDGLEVTIEVAPRANNLSELRDAAEDYEARMKRAWTAAQRRHQELTDRRLRLSGTERRVALQDYNSKLDQYEQMLRNAPDVSEASYTFDYDYAITTEPDFNGIFAGAGPSDTARRAHSLDLLGLAAREAIERIEVSR